MANQLYASVSGDGDATLVLLHGLSANAEVWRPLLEHIGGAWPGRIVVPDLRGHGRSPHARHYSYGHYAADVAELLQPGARIALLCHSMGAAVGLALASGWFGVQVGAMVGFSVKVNWSEEELRKKAELARTPVRWFDSFEEAAGRYLRVSGLAGLLAADHPAVAAGVVANAGRYRLAADIATFGGGGADIRALRQAAQAPLHFGAGSRDPMVSAEELRVLDPEGFIFEGLGHNLHVENPAALWRYAESKLRAGLPRARS